MAVAIVVVGLAISAPPGLGMAGNHDGLLVHPIFPHSHGAGHIYAADDPSGSYANHEPASADAAPGLSAPLTVSIAKDATAGVVVPFAFVSLALWQMRRIRQYELPLAGRVVTPPTPPPRIVTSLV